MPHDLSLLRDIALGIVFAVVAAHLARLLRQPLLLGYIVGGVLLSDHLGFGLVTSESSIELISEVGLILLLFIIGLEINLRELGRLGRPMTILGVSQFVISALLGLAFFSQFGYQLRGGNFDLVYLAIVMSLSSTLIVVKLLRDKFELKTLAGRLTLGVLIFQDIWAILFMAVQPNLNAPTLLRIVQSTAGGTLLVALAFVVSRQVLARVFEASARRPELILLTSIAWCFVTSGTAEYLGLSRAMGALIAGISISAFPYGGDVTAKITGVRDFFVTLFFVALGMKLSVPTPALLYQAGLVVLFVYLSRLVSVVPVAYLMGEGLRAGIISALNLSQISEFSLVIVALGVGYGHLSPGVEPLTLAALILAALASTYVIAYNDGIARWLVDVLVWMGLRDDPGREAPGEERQTREIVLLGHFRIAQAVLDLVDDQAKHLKERIMLVDYNASLGLKVRERGFHWEYGDLAHPDALEHLGIESARIIVTTISDTFLKGIPTRSLVGHLRRLAPHATIIMTGEDKSDREDLLRGGADHVLIPGEITGERILELLAMADTRRRPRGPGAAASRP
jgi:Kef-type K+ transport system membrane component KefB